MKHWPKNAWWSFLAVATAVAGFEYLASLSPRREVGTFSPIIAGCTTLFFALFGGSLWFGYPNNRKILLVHSLFLIWVLVSIWKEWINTGALIVASIGIPRLLWEKYKEPPTFKYAEVDTYPRKFKLTDLEIEIEGLRRQLCREIWPILRATLQAFHELPEEDRAKMSAIHALEGACRRNGPLLIIGRYRLWNSSAFWQAGPIWDEETLALLRSEVPPEELPHLDRAVDLEGQLQALGGAWAVSGPETKAGVQA